ncbi:MAG: phosphotransferase family protein [Nocardioidaceae bacterium]
MDAERTTRWTDFLRRCGLRPTVVLGSGMEGTVVDVGDDLVAKIWHRRTASELEALTTFYDAVAAVDPGFRTPRIHQVLRLDDQLATVETRLHGTPLAGPADRGLVVDDAAVTVIIDVLAGLAALPPRPGMGVLPVLEDEPPFDTETMPFAASLAGLVERRVKEFHEPLSARLPRLDVVVSAVVDRLDELSTERLSLVHGDLIPANVLVDDTTRPHAVLDFGFLSTVGDPAFDAAITASIFDMYGPHAAQNEAVLDGAIADRFGYPPGRLAVYRAAYALITSNCFSVSGSDGHFEWCARMLERPQVLEALEL